MDSALEIDGKKLHSIRDAAQSVSYSRDYVTRLAREGKIVATNVGRQWFVDLESLMRYVEQSAVEQLVRKKQLSEERKQEKLSAELKDRQISNHNERTRFLKVRALVVTFFVLSSGLLAGFVAYETVFDPNAFLSFGIEVNNASKKPPLTANTFATLGDTSTEVMQAELTPKVDEALQTKVIHSLGDIENGILLLPEGESSVTPEDVFSDTVLVKDLPDGGQAVVRLDAEGNEVGNKMPFAVIPVKRETN